MDSFQNSIDYIRYLIEEIMRVTEQTLKGTASAVLVVDEENQELRFELVNGPAQAVLKDATLGAETGFEGWVARHGKPLIVNDVTKDRRFCKDIDEITGFATKSIICVPLFSHNRVIGVIEVLNKRDGRDFNKRDLNTLISVASTSARAIQLKLACEAVLASEAHYSELVGNLTVKEAALFNPCLSPDMGQVITQAESPSFTTARIKRETVDAAGQEHPDSVSSPVKTEKRAADIITEVEARASRRRQAILGWAVVGGTNGLSSGDANKQANDETRSDIRGDKGLASGEKEDALDLFEGTVEVALLPPVDLEPVLQIHKQLAEAMDLDVIKIGGSLDRGIMIRIAVRNPMPLIDVMSKLPQVAEVVEESSTIKHEKTGRLEDGHPPRRIIVNTKR